MAQFTSYSNTAMLLIAGMKVLTWLYDGATQLLVANPIPALSGQLADAAKYAEECRRLAVTPHPKGLTGQGQGKQLATCARRSIYLALRIYGPQDKMNKWQVPPLVPPTDP